MVISAPSFSAIISRILSRKFLDYLVQNLDDFVYSA